MSGHLNNLYKEELFFLLISKCLLSLPMLLNESQNISRVLLDQRNV